MYYGAQLYTLRQYTQTPEDLRKTCERLKAMGCKYVQVSAICPTIAPEELACIMNDNGLVVCNTHSNQKRITDDTDALIREHKIFNCNQIGIGCLLPEYQGSLEGIRKFISDYKPAAQKIIDSGMTLAYHNHSFEFMRFDGTTLFEVITEEFPELHFIPDVYWFQYAGKNPAKEIRKLKGKIEVCHFKDIVPHPTDGVRMAPVMEGNLDFEDIISACNEAGVKYAMVEQDDCYDLNAFDAMEISFKNLSKVLKSGGND